MNYKEFKDWEQRHQALPSVWATVVFAGEGEDECEGISAYYESKEAAEFEVAWRKRKRIRVTEVKIYSLEMSRERWGDATTKDEVQ